jgi:hypothetical protein
LEDSNLFVIHPDPGRVLNESNLNVDSTVLNQPRQAGEALLSDFVRKFFVAQLPHKRLLDDFIPLTIPLVYRGSILLCQGGRGNESHCSLVLNQSRKSFGGYAQRCAREEANSTVVP